MNRPLVILILCYVGLSLFSLLLLPVTQIFRDLWFFGFPRFFFYIFIGPPHGFYYPVAAVIRLILFVVLAIQISRTIRAQVNYLQRSPKLTHLYSWTRTHRMRGAWMLEF